MTSLTHQVVSSFPARAANEPLMHQLDSPHDRTAVIHDDAEMGEIAFGEIVDGEWKTFVEENGNGNPVTILIKRNGRNDDDVLSVLGRRRGSDRDEIWHVNPATGRWRLGRPRPAK